MCDFDVGLFGIGDQNIAWQVILMIQQDMSLDATLDGFELGPGKQV